MVDIPFELRPDVPDEGISSAAHGLEHDDRVKRHLRRLAEKEGIPFQEVDLLPNTHKAMLMAESARDEGVYPRVHTAIFAAYFGDGEDIGDETVLLRVARENGLDPRKVVEAWASGKHEERLHAFRHLGEDLGVTATPAALICNELMIGSRPYGVIRDAVGRCLVTAENVAEKVSEGTAGAEDPGHDHEEARKR